MDLSVIVPCRDLEKYIAECLTSILAQDPGRYGYEVIVAIAAIYEYDAWGNCRVCTGGGVVDTDYTSVGHLNPFRYRGYYYDRDLGLYYLMTRWYDPETGRFISPDGIEYLAPETLNGLNLYAYCLNDPMTYTDPNGTLPIWANLLIGGAVLLGLGILSFLVPAGGVAAAVVGGAMKGAIIGAVIGAGVGGIAGGVDAAMNGEDVFLGVAEGIASGFASGAVTGMFSGGISSFSSTGITGTRLLVQRGMQVGFNIAISQAAYAAENLIEGDRSGPVGTMFAPVDGVVEGFIYNLPTLVGAMISFFMEILSYIVDWADESILR